MFSWFSDPIPVGTAAPPFMLPDEEGSVFVLNLQRNHYVVFVFYPGDVTPVCTTQLCEVRDRWQDVTAKGARVLGINPQGAESHGKFRSKHKLPFPLLVDNGKRVARLYKAGGAIVADLSMSQPQVSKHLRVLSEVGLVTSRAEGRRRLYSLEPARLRPFHDWLGKYEQAWSDRLDRMDDYLRDLQQQGEPQ